MQPLVSVIIPTKNSARTIEKCLLSIKNQSYENIEIIVVDNFSTDETFEIAKEYSEKVYQKGPERTQQKNYGIEVSEGEYVVFIDSDMELTLDVISACIIAYQEQLDIGGICIPEDSVGEGLFVQIRAFERSFYADTQIESARFFRRADVLSVGGFEEDLIFFEESLLPQKIEAMLHKSCHHRISAMIHHHEGDISLGKWLKKKFYYGKSLKKYTLKTHEIGVVETGKSQMGLWNRYWIFLSDPRFYRHPLMACGVLFLKTMEFGVGGIGLLYSKVQR